MGWNFILSDGITTISNNNNGNHNKRHDYSQLLCIHAFTIRCVKRKKSNWRILYCQTFLIFCLLLFVRRSSFIGLISGPTGVTKRGGEEWWIRRDTEREKWKRGWTMAQCVRLTVNRESESETEDKKSENGNCLSIDSFGYRSLYSIKAYRLFYWRKKNHTLHFDIVMTPIVVLFSKQIQIQE